MELQLFAVRDRALNGFDRPFTAPAVGLAIRSFTDEVNRPDSPLHAHPDDYDLYHVGSFDDTSGRLLPLDNPVQVAIGKNCLLPTV